MIRSGSGGSFAAAEAGGESPLDGREHGTYAVLVVEDDHATRDLFASTLSQTGFSVNVAADGLEALGRIESRQYDAVVLDLHLPRLDGMGVLRFVNERHPRLLARVVLVTGLGLHDIAPLYPICGTLPKPVTAAKLVEIVRGCLIR